jgi:membrane protein YqaA with SNARE-associated domain
MGLKEDIVGYAGEPWFPLLVGLLHAADTFILIVPNEFFLAAAVLGQPKRWQYCAYVQTLGCTFGCLLFCAFA